MQKVGGNHDVFDGESNGTYMMGAGGDAQSNGTYMQGARNFDDDESEMIKKVDDDESDGAIHKIESGVGGFDHDP